MVIQVDASRDGSNTPALVVDGSAELRGILEVNVRNNSSNNFTIIVAQQIVGGFSGVRVTSGSKYASFSDLMLISLFLCVCPCACLRVRVRVHVGVSR